MNLTTNKTRLGLILLIITMLLVNAGCTTGGTTAPTLATQTFIILQGVDATTLDPGMHSETPTANVERQLFDTLLEQDAEMKIQPLISTSWEMIDDSSWKFEIRDDVYFHDGEQLTATDVKYSIERILDKENASSQISNFSAILSITIEDDFNFTITTDGPYPLLLTRLSNLRIVPKHYITEVGNEQFGMNPIGSGPYMLTEWIKDEHVLMESNESYWQGAPNVKKIMFKPVPEAAARVMALQKGEADIIVNLPPHQVAELDQSEGVGVESVDSTRFIMLPITSKNPAVSDVRVRKALNYAIDVDSIIDNIFGGNATLSAQPVGNYDLGYHTGIKPYGYDPEKARQLLAEAGYESGLKIKMGSPSGRYIMDKEVAEAIKAQLDNAGFEVELTFPEWGNYVTELFAGELEYDLWLIGWGSNTFDAGSTLDFWLNSSLKTCYYQANEEVNNQIDRLLEESLQTINEESRVALYHQIIEQVYNDAAFVNLYQQVDLYGVSDRIEWNARPDEAIKVFTASWK